MVMHEDFVFACSVESSAGASAGLQLRGCGGEDERDVVIVSEGIHMDQTALGLSLHCRKMVR